MEDEFEENFSDIFTGGLPSWHLEYKNTSLQKQKFVEIMLPLKFLGLI